MSPSSSPIPPDVSPGLSGERRWLIVGNEGCPRVSLFQTALAQRGEPDAELVTYAELLRDGPARLVDRLAVTPERDCLVRFESAAENVATQRLLLAHGIEPALAAGYPAATPADIAAAPATRGVLLWPRQLHLGFVRLLTTLQDALDAVGVRVLNPPRDIALLFDKPTCQAHFRDAGVPVPRILGVPRSYAELRSLCGRDGRFVLKPAHGAGAAGCLLLHFSRGRVHASTTVAFGEIAGRLWPHCSRRTRQLRDEVEIAAVADWLCGERAHVEEWLPKAQLHGRGFDLRIVTIGGRARHAVPRVSSSPFTNLNLGGDRGDLSSVIAWCGPDLWRTVLEACERAAASLPHSLALGIDVAVTRDRRRCAVLEANAFGDWLKRVQHDGVDTYTAIVDEVIGPAPARQVAKGTPTARHSTAATSFADRLGRDDLLFVTFDALRYDVAQRAFVGGRTPHLARCLPATGWEERHSPGTFTFAAHVAFFAGFLPTPIRPGRHPRLFATRFPGSTTTTAATCVFDADNVVAGLTGLGYHTICIGGVGFFNRQSPLGNVLPSLFAESHWSPEFGVTEPASTAHQVRAACAALQRLPAERRVFLFVNLAALHPPTTCYLPGETTDSCDTQQAALEYVDRQLPPLFAALRRRGSGFGILCSDHGTAFGDDGYVGHRLAHPVVWNVPYAEFTWEREP